MVKKRSPYHEYDILEQIGTGSFGTVHKAVNKATHQIVAIKVMKRTSGSAESTNIREYKTLKNLVRHPNIVKLHDSFVGPSKELYFVMEYMDQGNLYQLIKERREVDKRLEHSEVCSILRQILTALAHLHEQGIFHRDMKPENLLISSSSPGDASKLIIKLADFGLARELKSKPPYTDYVSTRWYRAPEVLLHSTNYSYPVDLWAVGAIFAELVTLRPLFPGQSEIDQLYRICRLLGSPLPGKQVPRRRSRPNFVLRKSDGEQNRRITTSASTSAIDSFAVTTPSEETITNDAREWPDGIKLAQKIGFSFPQLPPKSLSCAVPYASPSMLDLLSKFLIFDPSKRINATDALDCDFFKEYPAETIIPVDKEPVNQENQRRIQKIKSKSIPSLIEKAQQASAPKNLGMAKLEQQTQKSILLEKATAAPVSKPSSWMAQDIKDAFRLSKSKTIDRLHRKKPPLTTITTLETSVSQKYEAGRKTHDTDQQRKRANRYTREDDPTFDLPSIPILSPIQMCHE